MKYTSLLGSCLALSVGFELLAGQPMADFSTELGPVRPELHSSGFGPTICSLTQQALDDVKAMGFKSARTHDWALINPNERVCDWHHIFPLENLDATKPENYVFGPTDYLLKRTREEAGLDIFFRLGTSIEHSGPKIHFNTLIPKDFNKVAEVFAGTVRHYNRGWAKGHRWNIRYWEIWNEPDGVNNMFCLPEGDIGANEDETKQRNTRRRELFAQLFVTCLRRLKSEFGDEIKVGGPALCSANEDYFRALLKACKEANLAPDFISWHGYTDDPWKLNREAVNLRRICDEYGFPKCELIVNEWHYFGSNYSWADMQRCSDPAVKARIWEGPDSHNGIRSSCFTLSTLAHMQDSKLDQAFYYGCSHIGNWGFKDALHKKYKVFYALKLFGDLMKDYTTRCAFFADDLTTVFPVKRADGHKALLVVDYGGSSRTLSIEVKGIAADAKVKALVLDHTHDLESLSERNIRFKDGRLQLTKPDFFSAAFLVEFD